MPTANAALISDHPWNLADHGIECVPWSQARSFLKEANPSILAVHVDTNQVQEPLSLLLSERKRHSKKHFILVHNQLSSEQICDIHNQVRLAQVHTFSKQLPLERHFAQAFDRYFKQDQSDKLTELIQEKNEQLKTLTIDLEKKVESRQEQLEESRQKNILVKKQLEVLRRALVQIYQASSIREMEHGLAHVLKEEFSISWVQVRVTGQSNLSGSKRDKKLHTVPLKNKGDEFGQLIFYRKDAEKFSTKDKRFLSQVAEAVSLAIQRTYQYEKSQELKRQWEATFDAISDPICLTDKDYNILRINSSFLKKTQTSSYSEHIGDKCYNALFLRSSPCEGCQRGKAFQIRNPSPHQSQVFDVYSNDLGAKDQTIYFQVYRDVTQDLNLQRQVIESAKMAELGTISSSIAHELNNPIGGMLNFIQLMKMDLKGNEEFYPDIIEIEKGITKCRDIVKNLLGFSRRSFHADIQEISLHEVIEQAIRITELKTRSIGIKIYYDTNNSDLSIPGRFNLLTHAIRNILQNSQESLIEKRRQDKSFQGEIRISVSEDQKHIYLHISDNGPGIKAVDRHKIFDPLFTTKDPETNSGLGLTLALQIVKEHKGDIKVTTDKDENLCFKITFSKPQGQSGSAV